MPHLSASFSSCFAMDSKAVLLLFLLLATILHFTATASSLVHHEELKIKATAPPPLSKAPALPPLVGKPPTPPLAKLPTPPLAKLPRPPVYKAPPPPPSDCFRLCGNWCKWHSRCKRVCTKCCDQCHCVPPFTRRNWKRCHKCHIDMPIHGKIIKCP